MHCKRAFVAGWAAAALAVLNTGCTPSEDGGAGTSATGAGTAASTEAKPDYNKLPLGLDPYQRKGIELTEENPIQHELVVLGKHLYFDTRLSKDETVACATCHDPDKGWTDQLPVSVGISAQEGGRSAPTVINRVFSEAQFWDGRAATLEEQAAGPITNPIEMGMESHDLAVNRIAAIAGYKPLFKAAFGDEKVDLDRITKAIATFERTIVSGNSPYDRYESGDKSAMSESAVRGKDLFFNKARCSICHSGMNFTDELYHNLGVGGDSEAGREAVTKDPADRGKFKTPTLRNITDTFPYMHDGSEKTLAEVIEFYDKGGNPNPNLDKEMKPLNLTAEEKKDLIAFLEALTGEVTKVERPQPVK